jgi:hypothetical protein
VNGSCVSASRVCSPSNCRSPSACFNGFCRLPHPCDPTCSGHCDDGRCVPPIP